MAKFKITVERDLIIEAKSGREAAKMVFLAESKLPVAVNGRYIKDHCEACNCILFGDEDFRRDEDGLPFCTRCYKKL